MHQFENQSSDAVSSNASDISRLLELSAHRWNRAKSRAKAELEGIEINDGHWAVVMFLRRYYQNFGTPNTARTLARALDAHFSDQGGNRYLHRLFPGGPVAQGSRFANLPPPAYATDLSFGTSY